MRILVVEDDQKVGAYLEQGLREERFEVDRATNGMEAIAKAESTDYDLILLDAMISRKSGIDVTARFRAHGQQTPILMLTARAVPEDFRLEHTAGVNDVLRKPFYFDDLLNRIRALVPGFV